LYLVVGERTPLNSKGRTKRDQPRRAQEREPPLTPWVSYIYIGGEEVAIFPRPLTNTIFTNRLLGHHMRPIYNMGWAIPPTVAPQLLWFDGYNKA